MWLTESVTTLMLSNDFLSGPRGAYIVISNKFSFFSPVNSCGNCVQICTQESVCFNSLGNRHAIPKPFTLNMAGCL